MTGKPISARAMIPFLSAVFCLSFAARDASSDDWRQVENWVSKTISFDNEDPDGDGDGDDEGDDDNSAGAVDESGCGCRTVGGRSMDNALFTAMEAVPSR